MISIILIDFITNIGGIILILQGRQWEESGEYQRAVECYLKIDALATRFLLLLFLLSLLNAISRLMHWQPGCSCCCCFVVVVIIVFVGVECYLKIDGVATRLLLL